MSIMYALSVPMDMLVAIVKGMFTKNVLFSTPHIKSRQKHTPKSRFFFSPDQFFRCLHLFHVVVPTVIMEFQRN